MIIVRRRVMDYSRKLLISSMIFLVLTCFMASVKSQTICNDDNGNYTKNSTYDNNLNRVLSSLSTSINSTGFYYTSSGQVPNSANVLVMCRADLLLDDCKDCTEAAISEIRGTCPNQRQAVNYQERCMLKYSNETFYGRLGLGYKINWRNPRSSTSQVGFQQDLRSLLDDLFDKAAKGGDLMKVAAGNASAPDSQTIFAIVQCTPDLSGEDCTTCLISMNNDISMYCDGMVGCRVLVENCFMRYEIYPFYGEARLRELTNPPSLNIAPAPQVMSPPPRASGSNNGDGSKTRVVIISVIISVAAAVLVILLIVGYIIFTKRTNRQHGSNVENVDEISTVESVRYDYSKIRDATNDFSDENKLGEGGFGAVYKGKLPNGKEIAVKRLSKNSGQGDHEFKNEVLLLARLQHRNLVKLLGFALDGSEKVLVYEFVQNASLDKFIFDPIRRLRLDWERRRKIIGGIARGILYLHEDSRLRIIHRDLKAGNVLLDNEMNPKIADFGLARLFVQSDQTQGSTNRIVGTYGYMAPEYAMHGQFSIKSDVFSFGVLLLEIICGQRNTCFVNEDERFRDLLSFAWKNWREGTSANVIDPILKSDSGSVREMSRCINIGLLCVQDRVADRPTMASVVLMLSSLSMDLALPSEPAFFVQGIGYESNTKEFDINDASSSVKSALSKNEASISELYPR